MQTAIMKFLFSKMYGDWYTRVKSQTPVNVVECQALFNSRGVKSLAPALPHEMTRVVAAVPKAAQGGLPQPQKGGLLPARRNSLAGGNGKGVAGNGNGGGGNGNVGGGNGNGGAGNGNGGAGKGNGGGKGGNNNRPHPYGG